jgi:hypothetical protein
MSNDPGNHTFAPLTSENGRLLWDQLRSAVADWIDLYNDRGLIYCLIRDTLLAEKLIINEAGAEGRVGHTPSTFETWAQSRERTDLEAFLEAALEKLKAGLEILDPESTRGHCTVATEAAVADPDQINVNVNGQTVALTFKNSGGNDLHDIQTYLQEKLDVLEFIQMDCNKMEITQFPSSSTARMLKAPRVDKSNLSVADWYNTEKQSIHITQCESFVESVIAPNQRSQLKDLADDGFFIGTPSSGRSQVIEPDQQILLEQSQLEWETSSVLSSYSTRSSNRKKGNSRNRSFSNSSVSSVEEPRSKPANVGMFGRGRLARLAVNMSGYNDENISVEMSPRRGSSWWDSGY